MSQPPPSAYQTGEILNGRYRLGAMIGFGGNGHVFEAVDQKMKIPIAVKILQREKDLDAIETEAYVGARLNHELAGRHVHFVVPVTDFGVSQPPHALPFMVMSLLKGETLRSQLDRRRKERKPLPLGYVVQVMKQFASGLLLVHANGVVHCDVKPENIFLSEGDTMSVKLMDFGLAFELDKPFAIDEYRGTPKYSAPEVFRCERPRFATDVYALGVILYEMLTNRGSPWDSPKPPAGLAEYRTAHLARDMVPPSKARPEVPEELDRLVVRMLAKELDDQDPRRPDMEEIIKVLGRLQNALPFGGDVALVESDPSSLVRALVNGSVGQRAVGSGRHREHFVADGGASPTAPTFVPGASQERQASSPGALTSSVERRNTLSLPFSIVVPQSSGGPAVVASEGARQHLSAGATDPDPKPWHVLNPQVPQPSAASVDPPREAVESPPEPAEYARRSAADHLTYYGRQGDEWVPVAPPESQDVPAGDIPREHDSIDDLLSSIKGVPAPARSELASWRKQNDSESERNHVAEEQQPDPPPPNGVMTPTNFTGDEDPVVIPRRRSAFGGLPALVFVLTSVLGVLGLKVFYFAPTAWRSGAPATVGAVGEESAVVPPAAPSSSPAEETTPARTALPAIATERFDGPRLAPEPVGATVRNASASIVPTQPRPSVLAIDTSATGQAEHATPDYRAGASQKRPIAAQPLATEPPSRPEPRPASAPPRQSPPVPSTVVGSVPASPASDPSASPPVDPFVIQKATFRARP